MNFINKALFTAELYKNKRDCDLFALDTILREPTNVEPRDLKEDGPITIIADTTTILQKSMHSGLSVYMHTFVTNPRRDCATLHPSYPKDHVLLWKVSL